MDYVAVYRQVLSDLQAATEAETDAKTLAANAQSTADVATEKRAALSRMMTELERLPDVQDYLKTNVKPVSNTPV